MRLGPSGDGGQNDLGGRDGEVVPMVLPDSDEVDAQLVGQHRLIDDVADHLGVGDRFSVGTFSDITEGVETSSSGGPVPGFHLVSSCGGGALIRHGWVPALEVK